MYQNNVHVHVHVHVFSRSSTLSINFKLNINNKYTVHVCQKIMYFLFEAEVIDGI